MRKRERPGEIAWLRWAVFVTLILFVAAPAGAHQNKKKKKNQDANSDQMPVPIQTPDTDLIERDIGEMLAAFQLGDADTMHKYYSDNATFVRAGAFEPPIIGWQAYAADYKKQWSAFQSIQLIRRNTLIFTHPDVAWATYQWEFLALLNTKPFSARGQTTLVFNKVNGNWLIVLNHTSEICPANSPAQAPAAEHPETQPAVPQPGASGSPPGF